MRRARTARRAAERKRAKLRRAAERSFRRCCGQLPPLPPRDDGGGYQRLLRIADVVFAHTRGSLERGEAERRIRHAILQDWPASIPSVAATATSAAFEHYPSPEWEQLLAELHHDSKQAAAQRIDVIDATEVANPCAIAVELGDGVLVYEPARGPQS